MISSKGFILDRQISMKWLEVDIVLAQYVFILEESVEEFALRKPPPPPTRLCCRHAADLLFDAVCTRKVAVTLYFALLTQNASQDSL